MNNQEKIEKLCSDLARLEYNVDKHVEKITDQISKGVDKFELYESNHNGLTLDMQINVAFYEKSDRYVLTDTEALLVKEIPIPATEIEGLPATDLEKAIMEFKQIDLGTVEAENHVSIEEQKSYIDLQLLSYRDNAPDTFCAIMAKHEPEFPYEVSPEYEAKIAQLKEGQEVYAKFSSYFNLTPDNMRNLLSNPDAAVRKQFFAKPKPGDDPMAKKETYYSWVKPNIGETADNGTTKMSMYSDFDLHPKLAGLNFVETQDNARLNEVVHFLREGYEVLLTNRNKEGEPKVRTIVNAPVRSVTIYAATGPRIPKGHKQFLKDPIKATLGENGIELHRHSELKNKQAGSTNTQQNSTQLEPNRLAGRQRFVNDNTSNGLGMK